MGEQLQKLCHVLNTISVENHKFSARVVTEGRAKLWNWVADVTPWDVDIGGHSLKPLGKEEITAATKMGRAKCEESFMHDMTEYLYHLEFHKSITAEAQSADKSLMATDWERIQLTNFTFKLSQKLCLHNEWETTQAYFTISGLVIEAANMLALNQHATGVHIFIGTHYVPYCPDQEVFMSTKPGDRILTLDEPFKLGFSHSSDTFQLDADGYIQAVYGLKYDVDGDKGIVIRQAGLTMVQHLSSNDHQNQLLIFSGQMKPRLAQFSAKIAAIQSWTLGGPASSSNSSPPNLLDLP